MKHFKWQILLGIILITLSGILYFTHYTIFHDAKHIFIYLLGDVAFVPIEVLLVTLIISSLLNAKEKKALLNKMNMVIGAFFSEVGTKLLENFSCFDPDAELIQNDLIKADDWSGKKFQVLYKQVRNYNYVTEIQSSSLEDIRDLLVEKRSFLLALLQNPNLLEHDSFTDLLWAVFHLTEELTNRNNVRELSDTDYEHISIDIKRVYSQLASEWLDYMKHLKDDYPYLFSLAMRMNPFDPCASPEVK